MRDWAALDWRAFGLAWIAVVFGGDHLERQNVSRQYVSVSRSKMNSVSTSRSNLKKEIQLGGSFKECSEQCYNR